MHKRSNFICTRVLHSLPAAERLLCLQESWGASWDPSGSSASSRGMLLETGEFCNILPDWKSGALSGSCRISVLGSLDIRFCNVFILDCWLNSLQQLVYSQLFCLTMFVISLSGGLSWLCPEHFPGLRLLLRSSLHFFSHFNNFLEEFWHLIVPAVKVSHIQMPSSSYLVITRSFYHFGTLEQCIHKTWSIAILRPGKQQAHSFKKMYFILNIKVLSQVNF